MVTPLKINTCLFHPKLSWFSSAVSIKGITGKLNHLSKVGNKLKSDVGVKLTSPWIRRVPSGLVQKSRNDKASPYCPSITSTHASQRDILHPASWAFCLSLSACLPSHAAPGPYAHQNSAKTIHEPKQLIPLWLKQFKHGFLLHSLCARDVSVCVGFFFFFNIEIGLNSMLFQTTDTNAN